MHVPLEKAVAAGDGVGERVVGGAVGSAMESWSNGKCKGESRQNCKVSTSVGPT